MKSIFIKEIPHKEQQYDTVGNYRKVNDCFLIEVCKLKGYVNNKDELQGVAVHELIELLLILKAKIKIKDIDAWDKKWENDNREPGEIKGSPYFKQHAFANKIEKLFLKELKKNEIV